MGASSSAEPPDLAARPRRPQAARVTETLYFAYGSNLHIAQMAQRCPESSFKGRATLGGWRWQINQRGVANVVRVDPNDSPKSAVEGLVFSVSPKDLRSLDRSEGVSRGFYQRYFARVVLEPHPQFYNMKTTLMAEMPFQQTGPEEPSSADPDAAKLPSEDESRLGERSLLDRFKDTVMSNTAEEEGQRRKRPPPPGREIKVLVYVSGGFTDDGAIRAEYILRMRKAVADAAALGVPKSFLDEYIAPHLVKTAQEASETEREVRRLKKKPVSVNETKASKALEGDHGHHEPTSEAPRNRHLDFDPYSTHEVSSPLQVTLHALQLENRGPLGDVQFSEFPNEMLEALERSRVGLGAVRKDGAIFVVAMRRALRADDGPSFEIKATTHDLDLANELAMKAFRTGYSEDFQKPEVQKETAAELLGIQDEVCQRGVEWILDEEGCLSFTVGTSTTGSQFKVWVEKQDLLVAV